MRDFQFNSGSLALDFVDTVAGRARGAPVDLLAAPLDLTRWFKRAGLVVEEEVTEVSLARARAVREAAHDLAAAIADDGRLPGEALTLLNEAAAAPDFRPAFQGGRVQMVSDRPIEAALSRIAADAICLLDPDTRPRIRRCGECRMLFRDLSRPGRRVWCSSNTGCGNRAKVRRHRERQAEKVAEGA
jgi:predicted RNA-binding Zn ribbon-like protein